MTPPVKVRGLVGLLALTTVLASPVTAAREQTLPYLKDVDEALELASHDGRIVVVSFVATWCPTCESMRRTVWTDSRLLELEDQFVWVQIDIDRNPSVARAYGVDGVPRCRTR